MPPTYEFHCEVCESITVEQFSMSARPDSIECVCGGKSHYRISAPNLMLKEAMLDGTKRKGWAEMREASKLNKEIGLQRTEQDKKRIEHQIKRLGVQVREK